MMSVMMCVMAQVNFATTLPAHAVEVLRDRARHDGLTLSAWLARAIYDKATRDSVNDPVDEVANAERRALLDSAERDFAEHFYGTDPGRSVA
jgi:hypothetical protein